MSYRDFSTHFQKLEICHLSLEGKGTWEVSIQEGSWKKRVNAGGCRNYPATFWTNPQYHVTIVDVDDDDDEDIGTLIVGLMQVDRRKLRSQGQDNLTIGYEIFKNPGTAGKPLDRSYIQSNRPAATSPCFINMREVCGRHRLPPGNYVVMPSTFEPNEEASFILRTFSEKKSGLREMDEDTQAIKTTRIAALGSARGATASAPEADDLFDRYTKGEDQLDAFELKDLLNAAIIGQDGLQMDEFDLNMCRSFVALKDADQSGRMGRKEFEELYDQIMTWKAVYLETDEEKKGYFNSFFLREALRKIGIQTSNATYNTIVQRYSDKKGRVRFEDFIACIVKLRSMFDIYRSRERDAAANFSLDEFIQMTTCT